jgi:hypothetical protein
VVPKCRMAVPSWIAQTLTSMARANIYGLTAQAETGAHHA